MKLVFLLIQLVFGNIEIEGVADGNKFRVEDDVNDDLVDLVVIGDIIGILGIVDVEGIVILSLLLLLLLALLTDSIDVDGENNDERGGVEQGGQD